MCSRYSVAVSQEELFTAFDFGFRIDEAFTWHPSFNIAPTHKVPVVSSSGFEVLQWGIEPWWELNKSILFITQENLLSKSTFQQLDRCVMPLTGFFEWREQSGVKIPVHFSDPNREVLGFAALRKGNRVALITTEPSGCVSQFHTRMPSLIAPEEADQWIKSGTPDLIVRSWEPLVAWDVDRKMGQPAYNQPDCIQRCDYVDPQPSLFG